MRLLLTLLLIGAVASAQQLASVGAAPAYQHLNPSARNFSYGAPVNQRPISAFSPSALPRPMSQPLPPSLARPITSPTGRPLAQPLAQPLPPPLMNRSTGAGLGSGVPGNLAAPTPLFPTNYEYIPMADVPLFPNGATHLLPLRQQVEKKGFTWGSPVFLRVFKKENVIELWMQIEDGSFRMFRSYPICIYSGELGPKTQQGDKQSPEGFYNITRRSMNPRSRFKLSMDMNYPNAYDRQHGYTGNLLMIHGKCSSVGCYAMGDNQIQEIYSLVGVAFEHGQKSVAVHAFPFRLTANNLSMYRTHRWYSFWQMLMPGFNYFEATKRVPDMKVINGRYVL